MLFDNDGMRNGLLGGTPVAVAQSFADITHPRCCNPLNASRPYQLIEEDIRNRSDQGQAAPLLANDFVGGRKRDQRF